MIDILDPAAPYVAEVAHPTLTNTRQFTLPYFLWLLETDTLHHPDDATL